MNESEFKAALSERLCDLADVVLNYYNPCRAGENRCLVVDDIAEGRPVLHCCYNHDRRGEKCSHLVEGKCTFRNVGCRLWLCATAIANSPECAEALRVIENFAKIYGLVNRPYLGDRYTGRDVELEAMKAKGLI